jgi:hypothetical protein
MWYFPSRVRNMKWRCACAEMSSLQSALDSQAAETADVRGQLTAAVEDRDRMTSSLESSQQV